MKKILFLAAALCLAAAMGLTGCRSGHADTDYSNTYNPKTDYPYMFREQGRDIRMGASDEGYYFLNGSYLYYADKSTMKPVLLDNRPDSDCLKVKGDEDNIDCNAYVDLLHHGYYPGFLQYYEGKVYIVQFKSKLKQDDGVGKSELVEMSPDGSKRKSIITFDFPPQGIAIHRGFLYYSTGSYSKDSKLTYAIMKFDLKGSSKPEPIYEGHLPAGNIVDLLPYGGSVYFLESGKNMYRTMRYDLKNRSVSKMFSEDSEANAAIEGIFNDKLIMGYWYGDIKDERSYITYSSNLDGTGVKPLPIQKNFLTLAYTSGSYLFARPSAGYLRAEEYPNIKDEMTVYNDKLEVVDHFDLSFLSLDHHIVVGDDNYLFVHAQGGERNKFYILDKKDIGSGHLALKPFIDTPMYGGGSEAAG